MTRGENDKSDEDFENNGDGEILWRERQQPMLERERNSDDSERERERKVLLGTKRRERELKRGRCSFYCDTGEYLYCSSLPGAYSVLGLQPKTRVRKSAKLECL